MANAKNVRVEYQCEATINLGDFQNVKPMYKASADVPDGVHPNVVYNELKGLIDPLIQKDFEEAKS